MPRRPDAPFYPARRVGLFVLRSRGTHNELYQPACDILGRVEHRRTSCWVRRISDIVGQARHRPSGRSTDDTSRQHIQRSSRNLSANFRGTSFATIIVGMDMGSLSATSMPQPHQVGPDAPPACSEGVGLFMLRHCDRFHPCRRPPTSLLEPGRGSSRAVLRLRIYLPIAGLNVSRR